jgi:hypothetical protein
MRFSKIGLSLIVVLVLAVTLAGCSGTSSAPPASGGQAATTPKGSSSGSGAAPGSVDGSQLFGGLSYNWVEYRMVTGSGQEKMTIYFRYDKSGRCTMRFEGGTSLPGMPAEMDCSATGQAEAAGDPNEIGSEVQLVKAGTESVTVPAGTFVAEKYTASVQGSTATYWFVTGKPLIRMEGGNAQGTTVMELNGWG